MNEVNTRYEAMCKRRDVLQDEVSVTRLTDSAIQEILVFAKDVFVGIENADFNTKRRNLEMLDVKIVVDSGQYRIESITGKWEGEIQKIKRNSKVGSVNDCNSLKLCPPEYRFPASTLPLRG
jgi:hypothetical protein